MKGALSLVVHFGLERHIRPLTTALITVGAAEAVLLIWTLLYRISFGAVQWIIVLAALAGAAGYVAFQRKVR